MTRKLLLIAALAVLTASAVVYSATISATATGNWGDAATWNSAVPTLSDSAIITNSVNVTLTNNSTCSGCFVASGGSLSVAASDTTAGLTLGAGGLTTSQATTTTVLYWGAGTSALTITGTVFNYGANASTTPSGALTASTNQTLNIIGKVVTGSTGVTVRSNSGGTVVVTNTGTTDLAVHCIGLGKGVFTHVGGTCTVNGDVQNDWAGSAIQSSGITTLNGNVRKQGSGNALYVSLGTFTLNGLPLWDRSNTGTITAILIGGTTVWTGDRTIVSGSTCSLETYTSGAVLNLQGLNLTNSGRLFLLSHYQSPTIYTGTGASIVNATSSAQTLLMGNTTSLTHTGPIIPSTTAVLSSSPTYGYSGDPQTGSATSGGSGGKVQIGSPMIRGSQ